MIYIPSSPLNPPQMIDDVAEGRSNISWVFWPRDSGFLEHPQWLLLDDRSRGPGAPWGGRLGGGGTRGITNNIRKCEGMTKGRKKRENTIFEGWWCFIVAIEVFKKIVLKISALTVLKIVAMGMTAVLDFHKPHLPPFFSEDNAVVLLPTNSMNARWMFFLCWLGI